MNPMHPLHAHARLTRRRSASEQRLDVSGAAELCLKIASTRELLDHAFAAIAESLPMIGQGAEDLAARLDLALSPSQSTGTVDTLTRASTAASGFAATVNAAAERDLAVGSSAAAVASCAAEMSTELHGVTQMAYGLRRTGINASIAAAKVGPEGAAFGQLTGGLTSLAARVSQYSSSIHGTCTVLKSLGATVSNLQAQATARMRNLSEDASAVGRAANGASSRLREYIARLRPAASLVQAIRAPVHQIMLAIQCEDIIRQKLQHIEMTFQELAEVQQNEDKTEQAQQAALVLLSKLASTLVLDSKNDLQALLDAVVPCFGHLAEVAKTAHELSGDASTEADAVRRLEEPLHIFDDAIQNVAGDQTHSRICDATTEVKREVAKLERTLPELVLEDRQLVAIHVQIRIEVARSTALQTASTISDELAETSKRFRALDRHAERKVSELRTALLGLERGITAKQAESERLRAAASSLSRVGSDMRTSAENFAHALSEVSALGAALNSTTQRFASALDSLQHELDHLDELTIQATEIGKVAESDLEQTYGDGWSDRFHSAIAPRLTRLADRFTVLDHSIAARQLAGLEIGDDIAASTTSENGSDTGDVVLF